MGERDSPPPLWPIPDLSNDACAAAEVAALLDNLAGFRPDDPALAGLQEPAAFLDLARTRLEQNRALVRMCNAFACGDVVSVGGHQSLGRDDAIVLGYYLSRTTRVTSLKYADGAAARGAFA